MKISATLLKRIIKEEVEKNLIEQQVKAILEAPQAVGRDSVALVQKFAEEQGVTVEDVHALWDWYNGLIQRAELPSDKKHKNSPEAQLLFALWDSPLGVDSSDIKASIESGGVAAPMVSGP